MLSRVLFCGMVCVGRQESLYRFTLPINIPVCASYLRIPTSRSPEDGEQHTQIGFHSGSVSSISKVVVFMSVAILLIL